MSYVTDPLDCLDLLEEFLNGMLTWCDQDGVRPTEQRQKYGEVAHSVSHETVIKMRDLVHVCVEAIDEGRQVEFPDGNDPMSYLTFTGSEPPRLS